MNLKLKRTPGIYIVGFMGSGKSTIARMFAEEIGWRFADLDDDIERTERKSIKEIFETSGEEEFRRIEHAALQNRIASIRRGTPTVVSLGGGTFTRKENIDLLQENGITVWIDADFEIIRRRVQNCEFRPLARDPERFESLYRDRRTFYSQAEFRVPLHVNDSRVALADLLQLDLLQR
jgi:shikimate kinase